MNAARQPIFLANFGLCAFTAQRRVRLTTEFMMTDSLQDINLQTVSNYLIGDWQVANCVLNRNDPGSPLARATRLVLHPDDRARAREIWGHALATGEDYRIEYRFKDKTGGYRRFLGAALPRPAAHGTIVAWFGTCTDIEEQRVLREQLEMAYQDLEAKVTFRALELEYELQALRSHQGSKAPDS